ncbi:MAG: hypothetical protein AAF430_09475 [Myxococcota bacterium]
MSRLQQTVKVMVLLAVAFLLAAPAAAQTYVITAKAGSATGAFVDLPAVGASPCPSITQGFRIGTMVPQTMTIGGTGMTPANSSMAIAFPNGCMRGNPATQTVMATGTMAGAQFTMPTSVISAPAAGAVQVVPAPINPAIQQLATSFSFNGPMSVPFEAQNQTMATGNNTAVWRQMRAGAWTAQTGRAGANFTWCMGAPPNPLCTNITGAGAASPGIIKNTAGPNAFGGTMGLVLTTGANTSSLAILGIPGIPGGVGLNLIVGMGSRAAGRGYAAYDTDVLPSGPIFLMYTLTMTGPFGLVGMVSTPIPNMLPAGVNRNFGFPWTTGTVVVRNTGTAQGNPNVVTHTAVGSDSVTGMGARNIQLVAGHLSKATFAGNNATANFSAIRLPEPTQTPGLLAGALILAGIAVWRSRANR